ncbi:MAG: ferrous iron transport protein A [Candidatus Omnitrophica bacterium]|nr:ferrous iron transport protein A [Candidatus Omnitrophota bacterium]
MFQTLWQRLFAPKTCGCCACLPPACPAERDLLGRRGRDRQTWEKTLNDVGIGQSVRIECLRGEEGVCQRLRELGFCESAVIEKVADNGGLICRVCDARIAISKGLAGNIIVKDLCNHPEVAHAGKL